MVQIQFTNNYSDELLYIYSKMRQARYVGCPKSMSKRRIKKHLKQILYHRSITGNLLDIMLIYMDTKIVGMSFPRYTNSNGLDQLFYKESIPCIKVGAIFVDENYRNKNIGYLACQQFFSLYPNNRKVWTSRKCNNSSVSLAGKLGFIETHTNGDYIIFKKT